MLGHLSIGVRELERAGRFYDAVMAPVGWVRLWTERDGLGYGPTGGNDMLAIFLRAEAHAPGPGFHLCFNCPDDAAVDAFPRGSDGQWRDGRRAARAQAALRA